MTEQNRDATAAEEGRFRAWLREVDRVLLGLCDLDHLGLCDRLWWEDYAAGVTPREAAVLALEDELFPF
jgi:hypothetical protein